MSDSAFPVLLVGAQGQYSLDHSMDDTRDESRRVRRVRGNVQVAVAWFLKECCRDLSVFNGYSEIHEVDCLCARRDLPGESLCAVHVVFELLPLFLVVVVLIFAFSVSIPDSDYVVKEATVEEKLAVVAGEEFL